MDVCDCPFCNRVHTRTLQRIHTTVPTATRVHTRFTFMQPAYIHDLPSYNPRTYMIVPTVTHVHDENLYEHFHLIHSVSSFLGHICQSYKHSFAEITKLLGTSADSLMPTPSGLHTLSIKMKCQNDLSPLYTSLRGQHRSPSTSQHQIRLSCGCEAPTQTHKTHHQTHEAPTSFQWWFSPNEECNVVPTMIPTCPTPRAHEILRTPALSYKNQ
jgi:hypothetical protein